MRCGEPPVWHARRSPGSARSGTARPPEPCSNELIRELSRAASTWRSPAEPSSGRHARRAGRHSTITRHSTRLRRLTASRCRSTRQAAGTMSFTEARLADPPRYYVDVRGARLDPALRSRSWAVDSSSGDAGPRRPAGASITRVVLDALDPGGMPRAPVGRSRRASRFAARRRAEALAAGYAAGRGPAPSRCRAIASRAMAGVFVLPSTPRLSATGEPCRRPAGRAAGDPGDRHAAAVALRTVGNRQQPHCQRAARRRASRRRCRQRSLPDGSWPRRRRAAPRAAARACRAVATAGARAAHRAAQPRIRADAPGRRAGQPFPRRGCRERARAARGAALVAAGRSDVGAWSLPAIAAPESPAPFMPLPMGRTLEPVSAAYAGFVPRSQLVRSRRSPSPSQASSPRATKSAPAGSPRRAGPRHPVVPARTRDRQPLRGRQHHPARQPVRRSAAASSGSTGSGSAGSRGRWTAATRGTRRSSRTSGSRTSSRRP